MIDAGRIDPNKKITFKEIWECRAIHKTRDGVVLLAKVQHMLAQTADGIRLLLDSHTSTLQGGNNFTHKIEIEVQRVSENAAKVIENLGGKVTAVYYDRETIHAIKNPERYAMMPPEISLPTHPTTLGEFENVAWKGFCQHCFTH